MHLIFWFSLIKITFCPGINNEERECIENIIDHFRTEQSNALQNISNSAYQSDAPILFNIDNLIQIIEHVKIYKQSKK